MPAVFIHGVPDTYRVWSEVTKHLSRTGVVTLALPGFASAVPPGFQSTKEEYVDWIIQELEQLSEPVDLVGHDWGCILVARVASIRPDLIRTWAAGGGKRVKFLSITHKLSAQDEAYLHICEARQASPHDGISWRRIFCPREIASEASQLDQVHGDGVAS